MFRSICIFTFIVTFLYFGFSRTAEILNEPPVNFPINDDVVITDGMTHKDISAFLEEKQVVASSLYFDFILSHEFENKFVQAGIYNFTEMHSSSEVADILTSGTNSTPLVRITFPEGFEIQDINKYLPESFQNSSAASHVSYLEGFLFPDTYFVPKNFTLEELVTLMQKNFNDKIETISTQISNSGMSEEDVVTLASIVEREAKDSDSKKIVAGILLNRLKSNMPLQTDAVFTYILHKTSDELTMHDLEMDSPYNTYTHKGLPPTPIANPGMESILAVLEPTESKYMYYLTDSDGIFHYAKTFEEHKQNKIRYLR